MNSVNAKNLIGVVVLVIACLLINVRGNAQIENWGKLKDGYIESLKTNENEKQAIQKKIEIMDMIDTLISVQKNADSIVNKIQQELQEMIEPEEGFLQEELYREIKLKLISLGEKYSSSITELFKAIEHSNSAISSLSPQSIKGPNSQEKPEPTEIESEKHLENNSEELSGIPNEWLVLLMIGVLLVLVLVLGILNLIQNNRLKVIRRAIRNKNEAFIALEWEKSEIQSQYIKSNATNRKLEQDNALYAKRLQVLANKQGLNSETFEKKLLSPVLMPPLPLSNTYFHAEVMVSAGPRKRFQHGKPEDGDIELGEDVAGFIIQDKNVYFWVLDGTSDSARLLKNGNHEYFSSRVLAQSIAWSIQEQLGSSKENSSIQEILKKALINCREDLASEIRQLDENDSEMLTRNLIQKKVLFCSSTILFGRISLDGNAEVIRIGDSYAVIQSYDGENIATPLSKSPSRYGRQFANLTLDSNQNPSLQFNSYEDLRAEQFQFSRVKTLLAMSDGIGESMLRHMISNPSYNFAAKEVRKRISNFQHFTQDDKALCIIQIREMAN